MKFSEIISEAANPAQQAAIAIAKQKTNEADTESCPPATQDIKLNLKNRQKAINEYGYGPLNPDMPNRMFWMKKVEEWNLDSPDEAKQSLCGNCAAFDQRQDTLDCIAQGIGSDEGSEDPTIEAGDLGYCRFLKFKCASRRTCDAWVTGGPLVDKQDVAEGTEDSVQIEYWQQDTQESGQWAKTKPMSRDKAEQIVSSFPRGEIVDVEQDVSEGENWAKHNNKRVGGMSKKSVASYRRSHPGSKIQTAVTTKPSKLKKGSKAAARRKSFCARMRGMKKHRTGAKTARDPNSNINKSLRRWNCESVQELQELVMIAEQFIKNNK